MSQIKKRYTERRSPEERAEALFLRREAVILGRIEELERKSLRSIRALSVNSKDTAEKEYLKGYETQIKAAREELAAWRASRNPAPAPASAPVPDGEPEAAGEE
jgi:hypothetical protein